MSWLSWVPSKVPSWLIASVDKLPCWGTEVDAISSQYRVVNGVTLVWAVPIWGLDYKPRSEPPGQRSKNKKKTHVYPWDVERS